MLEIQNNTPVPIYEQLYSGIKEMIHNGELKTGESLPSIRSLASTLDIASNTVARAYKELERAGFVKSYSMKGTFVCERIREEPNALSEFYEILQRLTDRGYNKSQIHQLIEEHFEKTMQ